MITRRALLAIVIFNEQNESIKPLVDSLKRLPAMLLNKLETVLVVYNKKLSKENEQLLLSLKQFSQARFIDYIDRHPKSDLAYYCRSKKAITKKPNETVSETEIMNLIKEK